MVKIREAIVVEGRYDKNTLSQVVDAPILETAGFGIFKDRQQMALLRRVAEKRGLIVFTDSDGAGFVIRNRIAGVHIIQHELFRIPCSLAGRPLRPEYNLITNYISNFAECVSPDSRPHQCSRKKTLVSPHINGNRFRIRSAGLK